MDFLDQARSAAGRWDADGAMPAEAIEAMAADGFLGADVPTEHGGHGMTASRLGQLSAQLGGLCSAARALLTVQGMVSAALVRWGSAQQRRDWLPALARGDVIAGFAATEPGAGTDLSAVATRVDRAGSGLSVSGHKVWVTFGEVADVFLVLGHERGLPVAVLVEADRPGVHRTVVRDQLGLRAARLAEVRFDDVRVPERNRVAPAGFGLSHVVATALDHGRFTVAYGCAGMAEACLDDAVAHASTRVQASVRLTEHQVVRAQLGRSLIAVSAAHQLCDRAARSREERSADAIADTFMAKYTAARCAATVSADAIQTMGAAGCVPTSRAARFYRDAKVMQIIEGTDHVAELHLGEHALRRAAGREEIPA